MTLDTLLELHVSGCPCVHLTTPEGLHQLAARDGFLCKQPKLTQIVVTLVHLSDVDFCGSLGDFHNAVIAQAGESMFKHA